MPRAPEADSRVTLGWYAGSGRSATLSAHARWAARFRENADAHAVVLGCTDRLLAHLILAGQHLDHGIRLELLTHDCTAEVVKQHLERVSASADWQLIRRHRALAHRGSAAGRRMTRAPPVSGTDAPGAQGAETDDRRAEHAHSWAEPPLAKFLMCSWHFPKGNRSVVVIATLTEWRMRTTQSRLLVGDAECVATPWLCTCE